MQCDVTSIGVLKLLRVAFVISQFYSSDNGIVSIWLGEGYMCLVRLCDYLCEIAFKHVQVTFLNIR